MPRSSALHTHRTGCWQIIASALTYFLCTHASHALGPVSEGSSSSSSSKDSKHAFDVTGTERSALKRLWDTPLALNGHHLEPLLRAAYKYEVHGRNWNRLAQKLRSSSSNITVAVFGGSVTAGHYWSCSNSSWGEEMVHWMEQAFPTARFKFVNLGHAATVASAAALCYYHDMPADVDLVVVEYSANGCGGGQCLDFSHPQVAGYEQLLRKIVLKAPQAALLSLAVFSFKTGATGNPGAYYKTGEDVHAVIARRYGVPMVSIRDALYDIMFDDRAMRAVLGMTRDEMMRDHIHPRFIGAKLYGAGFMAWAIRHQVTKALLQKHTQHGNAATAADVSAPYLHHYRHQADLFSHRLTSEWGAKPQQGEQQQLQQQQQELRIPPSRRSRFLAATGSSSSSSGRRSSRDSSRREASLAAAFAGGNEALISAAVDGDSSSFNFSSSSGSSAYAYGPVYGGLAQLGLHWQQPLLPRHVSPVAAQHLDIDSFCAAGLPFEKLATNNSGWSWADDGRSDCETPGCRKYGYKSDTPGSHLEFEVETTEVLSEGQARQGGKLALVIFHLKTSAYGQKYGPGIVRVTCESGCSCQPLKINGENTDMSSELDGAQTEVTPHTRCLVRATLLEETTTRGHKFRINGIALAPYKDSKQ